MAWHLRQCQKGALKRLLITLPPRYLKSICALVAFPAWGGVPGRPIVIPRKRYRWAASADSDRQGGRRGLRSKSRRRPDLTPAGSAL
jgi:hypothetical protein